MKSKSAEGISVSIMAMLEWWGGGLGWVEASTITTAALMFILTIWHLGFIEKGLNVQSLIYGTMPAFPLSC